MKLQFKQQKFQSDAVNAVCDVFDGQPFNRAQFAVDQGVGQQAIESNGYCNADFSRALNDDALIHNIQQVQKRFGLNLHDRKLEKLNGRPALTVEMETGTGKTYTYIKTIFELNKRYGWSKFIVVVPSVAIREGVYKTFQITRDHFANDYDGKKCNFFIYNSAHLGDIRSFSTDNNISVMIINSQAFNAKGADARRIHMVSDEFNGIRPIDSIAATSPIMIVDEPQSVLGKSTVERLSDFKPLFYLLYSATHRQDFNKVYRLDAVDAYQKKLVKRICVKGIEKVGDTASKGYLYLERINVSKNKNPTATVTMEYNAADGSGHLTKRTRTLNKGDNIYDYSGEIEAYRHGYQIADIDAQSGKVSFTGAFTISEGEVIGETNVDDIRRLQIAETIKSHLERERELYGLGIKVLSLFFIDEVAKYKEYDEHGQALDGQYAQIFIREYAKQVNYYLANHSPDDNPEYIKYLKRWRDSGQRVDAGYFAVDNKGRIKDSKRLRGQESAGDDAAQSAYDLIMKDKERLLSFDEPVRFIFSHSALREGWDNPNVFQICTLGNVGTSGSEIKKRQEIGRGLRLSVNQNGVRQDADVLGEDRVQAINSLTVVANESYDSFARDLQDELAQVIKSRPRFVSLELFQGKTLVDSDGNDFVMDDRRAALAYAWLTKSDLLDDDIPSDEYLNMTNDQRIAAVSDIMDDELDCVAPSIVELLDSVFTNKQAKEFYQNGRHNQKMYLKAEVVNTPEFDHLWSQINQKTYYQIDVNEDKLIDECVSALNRELFVSTSHLRVTQGSINEIERVAEGQAMGNVATRRADIILANDSDVKYDLIGEVASQTNLVRQTTAKILQQINHDKFGFYQQNPEEFIRKCIAIINQAKSSLLSNNIKYYALDGCRFDKSQAFCSPIDATPIESCREAKKHIYTYVRFDSDVEKELSERMDEDENIDFYIKLPKKFAIHTPVGEYNPDWAVVANINSGKHVYLVAESKGSKFDVNLRPVEQAKIRCAREHFQAISNGEIKYDVVSNIGDLRNMIESVPVR